MAKKPNINRIRRQYKRRVVPTTKSEIGGFYAWLGDRSGNVEADIYGNVHAIDFNGNDVIVYNDRVPLWPRRVVKIGYHESRPGVLQVLGFVDAYPQSRVPNIAQHADLHQWPSIDTLWVRGEQIIPGLAVPLEDMTVQLYGFFFYLNGWHVIDNTEIDFTAEIPASGAIWALVEIDNTSAITISTSSAVGSREMLEYEDIPTPSTEKKPLFAVKLYEGQETIIKTLTDTDIIDLRFAGYASGGVSTAVEWSDILNVPGEFNPDLDVTNPIYSRVYSRSSDPTENDDEGDGYKKGDIWVNDVSKRIFIAADVTLAAAIWKLSGGGGGIGGVHVDGALAVETDVPNAILITSDVTIETWYIHCKNLGTSGSTIVDINLNGTTIFTTQANRPELDWDDANGWAISGPPDFTSFVEGDVITFDIDQIADGAENLTITPLSPGASRSSGDPRPAEKVFKARYLR